MALPGFYADNHQELEHKSFFSRADVPTVAKLYETFFDAVAPAQRTLDLSKLAWGDGEVQDLLPVCRISQASGSFGFGIIVFA